MGMFDSVFANCPKCGKLVEFQSKGGDRKLKRYHISSVPLEIALSSQGDSEKCKCGHRLILTLTGIPDRVSMGVKESGEWD